MYIVLFIFLLSCSAFFSASEIALFSLTQGKIKEMLHHKQLGALYVWRLRQVPQNLLATILIGNNIVNTLCASLATVLAVSYFGDYGVGIATGVATMMILMFGEITPKSIAQKNNVYIALKTAPILWYLSRFIYPLVWALNHFNGFITNKILKSKKTELVTESEIRALARLGVEVGAIDYRERELIEKVFHFNDTLVKKVMTPRYKIVALNGESPVEQIAFFIGQQEFSRFPVYVGEEDNYIGYVHVNDVMKSLNSDNREVELQKLARPLRKVKATESLEAVFRKMRVYREHMMAVVDDKNYLGLVTMEDLVEDIFGEIEDENDD